MVDDGKKEKELADAVGQTWSMVRRSSTLKPAVSILMSVYNDAQFITESLNSVLAQTGPECELVIVDDAGTDASPLILDACTDSRVTLIRHYVNRGLAASLNHGLQFCRGRYIARQDGDDISEPGRIQEQFAFLETHPGIAYLGTGIIAIDEDGKLGRTHLFPEGPDELRELARGLSAPLAHPTLMFRREALDAVNGYDELFRKSEDYDLHLRLMARFRASSLRKALVRLRQRSQSMQTGDTSGECLKYVLFAYARQVAEQQWGALSPGATRELLAGISGWFKQGNLNRCWTASIHRRAAFESIVQGRRLQGMGALLGAIAQDPRWLADFILHGRRIVLTRSRRSEMEAVINRVVGNSQPLAEEAIGA